MSKPKSHKSSKSRNVLRESKRRKAIRPEVRKSASRTLIRRRAASPTTVAVNGKDGPRTKQAQVIAMLRASSGATIETIMHATDWQQHSVRGFLAAVIRKKLGLKLLSTATDSGRVYRIDERSPASLDTAKVTKAT